MGYPVITNRALLDFTNDNRHAIIRLKQYGQADTYKSQQKDGSCTAEDGYLPAVQSTKNKQPVIYPMDSGLVPLYTGHIPGKDGFNITGLFTI